MKSQLIEPIANKQSDLVERDIALAVNMMLERMTAWLVGGGRLKIRAVGSFSLRCRAHVWSATPRPERRYRLARGMLHTSSWECGCANASIRGSRPPIRR